MRSSARRGLQDIRTVTDLISDANNPPRKFLKLAVLEMEKVRRNKEKQSAQRRIADIDDRMVEIEAEQSELLAIVSQAPQGAEAADSQPLPKNSTRSCRDGFILRY